MLLVMLATPVGGWHPLNLHRNDYVMFFGISVMCVVVSLILCAFDKADETPEIKIIGKFEKARKRKEEARKRKEEQVYQLRKACQDKALVDTYFN
jgi:hypothetical protein